MLSPPPEVFTTRFRQTTVLAPIGLLRWRQQTKKKKNPKVVKDLLFPDFHSAILGRRQGDLPLIIGPLLSCYDSLNVAERLLTYWRAPMYEICFTND